MTYSGEGKGEMVAKDTISLLLSIETMFNLLSYRSFALVLVALSCHSLCFGHSKAEPAVNPVSVFTVQAGGHRAIVRALTTASKCPSVIWNGKHSQVMKVRVGPATIPARTDATQIDGKPVAFDVMTCEADWPKGAIEVKVGQQIVPAPHSKIRRIVIIADTGCRMKGSEKAFQSCNDPVKWPFAQVAKSAAALKPDLVIHIGDIHYRESPCPDGDSGCANVPWGYGFDAWRADFFEPAKPLLLASPWIFVRGNHEICARAGQGWFRFIDTLPWSETRSCDDPQNDAGADYSAPYAVPVDATSQFIVFDSSKTNGKPFQTTDLAFAKYTEQLRTVEQLASRKPSVFLSHHPLLAVVPAKNSTEFKRAGNEGLQSVFSAMFPDSFFPGGVALTMHGHVHLFESISFKGRFPASLVLGNSGSANEGRVPQELPSATELYAGAEVEDYTASADYGFATLDRIEPNKHETWLLTEYSTLGRPLYECAISTGKSRCSRR